MGQLTIYKNNYMDSTVISNLFIDEYMKDANDAQLKVYLYLLRIISSNKTTSISDMADMFNHTEKDITKALAYWEKRHLLSLEYDDQKNIVGIHLEEPEDTQTEDIVPLAPVVAMMPKPISVDPGFGQAESAYINTSGKNGTVPSDSAVRHDYSLDEVKAFRSKDSTCQLFFVTEQYLQKPLSSSDMNTILFLSEGLHFSDDLIDYLIQYCVDRGKRDFRYIEKVALNWAENGVTTPQQAEKFAHKYDKTIYSIMNALGKPNMPTPKEVEFITRWTTEYGFETDVIFEACERTVLATENHRFEYADKILSNWKNANVRHKTDIQKMDSLYQKKKNTAVFAKQPSNNKFNQFKQHDYDFDEIERAILSK